MATAYDEVRYPAKFFPQTTPERLAVLARLFGMRPAPVQRCRVLELGCGEGGNLIPVACALPESDFVGVDVAATAIAHGQELVAQLGLSNVELRVQDVGDFPRDAGQFDYIVAHGLYSWVPDGVRQQILSICERHLSADGVAYISYNTLPGGYLRRYPRELMRFHTRAIEIPAEKVSEARRVLDFVLAAHPKADVESELLRSEKSLFAESDAFLYHDVLAEVNDSFYLLDFLEEAAGHGLQFLSEADAHSMRISHFPEPVRNQLQGIADRRLREQYLDFIYCRRFRQTLLCRAGHPLTPDLDPRALDDLLISSSLQPTAEFEQLNDVDPVEFRTIPGQTLTVHEAIPKAMFVTLGEVYPVALSYEELLTRTAARLRRDRLSISEKLEIKAVRMLLSAFSNAAIEFQTFQPACVADVSTRPVSAPLARWQARREGKVVSATLKSYALPDALLRDIVALADGSRDLDQLRHDVSEVRNGRDHELVSVESLMQALRLLARYGMFIA